MMFVTESDATPAVMQAVMQALENKAKKVEKFNDVVLWNLTAALQKQLDWLPDR